VTDSLRVARFYFLLLALFTVGRWAQSLMHVEYARGHHVFSIVTLTLLSSVYFSAFCRRWRGYSLLEAAMLGMMLGLAAQLVIVLSTALSYALGMHTFFNHPTALNASAEVPLNEALVRRLEGLVAGPISNGIVAILGWILGGTLPDRSAPPPA
jgi:hypothetical protein